MILFFLKTTGVKTIVNKIKQHEICFVSSLCVSLVVKDFVKSMHNSFVIHQHRKTRELSGNGYKKWPNILLRTIRAIIKI